MRFLATLIVWSAIFGAGYYVGSNQPKSGAQIRAGFLMLTQKAGGDPAKVNQILEKLEKDPQGYIKSLGGQEAAHARAKQAEDAAEGKF